MVNGDTKYVTKPVTQLEYVSEFVGDTEMTSCIGSPTKLKIKAQVFG